MKAFQIQGNRGQYQTLDEESDYPLDALSNDQSPSFEDQKTRKHLAVRVGLLFLVIALAVFGMLTVQSQYLRLGQSIIMKITPYRQVIHPDPPTALWGSVSKPYPTGAFWTNLAIKNGDGAIGVYPYGVKTVDAGIQVSYGAFRRQVTSNAIIDTFANDIQISVTQPYVGRAIEAYDNVSVTMGYRTTANGKFRTYLVKGSPYITTYFEGTTPVISSPLMHITSVDAKIVQNSVGTQYILTLGNFQKWFVYCSESVTFTWKDNTLTAASAIRGFVRIAILPLQNVDSAFAQLLTYVQRYPIGAAMTLSYPTATTGCVTIQFDTVGPGSLLMFALPHHNSLLPASLTDNADSKRAQLVLAPIWSIKGKMKAIVGDTWKLTYNFPTVGWNYVVQEKLTNSQLDEVAKHLLQETKAIFQVAPDTYTFGKQLGRMARLALIADNLGIVDARQQAIFNLETTIIPWLQGMNTDPLVYDKAYGGLVSAGSLADSGSNFGSGWYSDHHFHFGYFLNAIAVIIKLDLPFYEANKAGLDTFVRDICNPDITDLDFPFVRHKDFFDGHSWASGLFQQANGKGQESSSEAVNAYYGAYLFAGAIGNADFQKFCLLLMTMEIQAAQTYWHMSSNDIYDNIFSSGKMVGNIGALDATASTWFGNDVEFVHGINIMPLSPVTAVLFDQNYVQQQYPVLAGRVPNLAPIAPLCIDNPQCKAQELTGQCCPALDGSMLACCQTGSTNKDEWNSYILIDLAIVDKETAYNQLLQMSGFGQGNSRTNSLFWAASRSPPVTGFNSSIKAIAPVVKTSCASNSACDALGITGDCCPTGDGSYLGCCARAFVPPPVVSPATSTPA